MNKYIYICYKIFDMQNKQMTTWINLKEYQYTIVI